MSLRDWIDPTRLYNPQLPAGRLNFVWGGCLVPIIVLVLSAWLIMKAYFAWGEDLCIFLISLPIMLFLCFGLYAISATRRLHDLGDPPDLTIFILVDARQTEEEVTAYYIRLLKTLIAEPGFSKNANPADRLTEANSGNH